MAPGPADPLVGRRISGRYELVALVGRGAMADVFRARDLQRGAEVAVKLVSAELVTSPVAAARFQREVKASSKLDHPSIVRVHAWGIDADHGYIVMDLVSGEDLYERLRRAGPMSPREAIGVAVQVLRGLEVAHAAGVIHRDLKPENIMIAPSGEIRILDFGIAKLRVTDSGSEEETVPQSLTRTGTAIGTPSHMAPEQARGGTIDGRADLYAVGVLLYEMVTGRIPFEGRSAIEIVLKQVRDLPVPPRKHAPGLPVVLEKVILGALEKEPSSRPRSAFAMRRALEAILDEMDDDEELDVPTQSGSRPPEGLAEGAEVVNPSGITEPAGAQSEREIATLERPWSLDDESTATITKSEGDDEATDLMAAPQDRFGPSGTWVQDEDGIVARARQAGDDEEETATRVAPRRALFDTSGQEERLANEPPAATAPRESPAPVAPEGMPSIHAWTSAPPPTPPMRPLATSELNELLRQLPPPPTARWRSAAVIAAVVASFGLLLWALLR